ncbi:hypothetical protein RCL_jg4263.t1 [Rhizophagus clarus]|uniref:Uncharacterized protein n=1 Tax=Rhizophagus clarus TaxID=94130 RepID=A0A8H3QE85_9GLOM|nr:hypothetical protein RCL_jg4263.t1 [Rhizophagus clarus]
MKFLFWGGVKSGSRGSTAPFPLITRTKNFTRRYISKRIIRRYDVLLAGPLCGRKNYSVKTFSFAEYYDP